MTPGTQSHLTGLIFGSDAGGGIIDTADYYDVCAIWRQQMKPIRVYVGHSGEEPPASLGMSHGEFPLPGIHHWIKRLIAKAGQIEAIRVKRVDGD